MGVYNIEIAPPEELGQTEDPPDPPSSMRTEAMHFDALCLDVADERVLPGQHVGDLDVIAIPVYMAKRLYEQLLGAPPTEPLSHVFVMARQL
jgi:hypothetical protein